MSDRFEVDTDNFRVELNEGVAELVFGAPGSMPFADERGHRELSRVWSRLDEHPGVRAILVRSEGKGFCAGGTLDVVRQMVASETMRLTVMKEARAIVQGMLDCDRPVVSAINGAAVGAGLAVALLADISIAARTARLIDGHTKLGVAAGDHAALIWPLLCGMAKAKYYLLLCETLSGEEAERIGVVSAAVDEAELLTTARSVSRRLADGSPTALAWTKRSLNHWLRAAWPAFEVSLAAEILGFAGSDASEGLRALEEKRVPSFRSVEEKTA
ncbi:enoyl-CoA hydratase/isomerase family protein [Paraburkholderia sp. USG1]|uniref:enoyl-CoA hydratase/isomerase family protein n=1 Tax=Paraburkholderia sp. USG1 TaxID=2952268 RepID=UPI0028602A60|nr:enoyl-CoA hydratase/isomerase family protein [Paraburkholderia sp. USG1]MDR8398401.1 enoyl-CoA hydratase/isomerase family protein [Paraburkholderia sp. USG1]